MVVIINGHQTLKVDVHTHILPRSWPETPGFPLRCVHEEDGEFTARMEYPDGRLFRKLKPNAFDPEVILQECDASGVDVQVMCTVPVMFGYDLEPSVAAGWSQFLNDDLAASCAARPDRLVGLGTLPLQDPWAAAAELRRCVLELGLRGVQIGSHVNAWAGPSEDGGPARTKRVELSDPELEPFWEEAERLQAAVLVHPWGMHEWCPKPWWQEWLVGMPTETAQAGMALVVGGVLQKHPALKVMLAHGGGALPFIIGRIDWGYRCRPDLVATDCSERPCEVWKRLYFDSITHSSEALMYLVDQVGAGKVALGSDFPFPLGEVASVAPVTGEVLNIYPGQRVQSLPLKPADISMLLAGTAFEWLGLPASHFEALLKEGVPVVRRAASATDHSKVHAAAAGAWRANWLWLGCSFATMLAWGLNNFIYGILAERGGPGANLSGMFLMWFTMGLLGLISAARLACGGKSLTNAARSWPGLLSFLAGAGYASGSLAMSLGIASDPASKGPISAMLALTSLLVVGLAFCLFGERVGLGQATGILGAVGGVVMMVFANSGRAALTGLGLGGLCACLFAPSTMAMKRASISLEPQMVSALMNMAFLLFGIFALAASFSIGRGLQGLDGPTAWWLVLLAAVCGLLRWLGVVAMSQAFRNKGPSGSVVTIVNANSLLVFLLDLVFFQPDLSPLKLAGAVLVVVAISLVTLCQPPPPQPAKEGSTRLRKRLR